MKKKILFLGRFPPPVHGASKMNQFYLQSKILNSKFKIQNINLSYSEKPEDIGKFSLRKIFGVGTSLLKIIKNNFTFKPNLVYFELAPTGFAFLRDSIYVMILKLFRKRIIFQIHARGIKEKTANILWEKYYKIILKNTRMILLSEILYSEVKKIIPKKNIYILPNGIQDELTEKKFKDLVLKRNRNKKTIFLFLSNMVEEKGALDVLKICNKLDEGNFNFECLFVGPWQEKGFKKKWLSLRKEYFLEEKCSYLGPKYGEEKKEVFQKSDFFIFPTKYRNESFPLVILESFMFGIPVLSYDQGAIREMVSKSFLGFVSEKKDWKKLEKEIEKKLKKLANPKRIREYFKKYYVLEISEQKLMKIFEKELKV